MTDSISLGRSCSSSFLLFAFLLLLYFSCSISRRSFTLRTTSPIVSQTRCRRKGKKLGRGKKNRKQRGETRSCVRLELHSRHSLAAPVIHWRWCVVLPEKLLKNMRRHSHHSLLLLLLLYLLELGLLKLRLLKLGLLELRLLELGLTSHELRLALHLCNLLSCLPLSLLVVSWRYMLNRGRCDWDPLSILKDLLDSVNLRLLLLSRGLRLSVGLLLRLELVARYLALVRLWSWWWRRRLLLLLTLLLYLHAHVFRHVAYLNRKNFLRRICFAESQHRNAHRVSLRSVGQTPKRLFHDLDCVIAREVLSRATHNDRRAQHAFWLLLDEVRAAHDGFEQLHAAHRNRRECLLLSRC